MSRYVTHWVNGRKVSEVVSSKGFTVVELLVVVAVILIIAGIVMTVFNKVTAKPEVINVQQTGKVECQGSRTITKVPYSQIETFLAGIPFETRIVQVVPVYKGVGDSFDIKHYIVITEAR